MNQQEQQVSQDEVAAAQAAMNRREEFDERERGVVRDPNTKRIIKGGLYGPNTNVQVRFGMNKVPSSRLNAIARRNGDMSDQYEEIEWIWKSVPGQHDNVNGPVEDSHIWEFPIEYALFKQGLAGTLNGTPLSTWGQLSSADIAELARYGVHTVESIANMSDGNAGTIRGFHQYKAKARAWLDQFNKQETTRELEDVKAELAELKALIKAQAATGKGKADK